MTIKRWYWRRVILPPRPLLIVPCLCWAQCAPPQQAFILRAAPLNCPHCSDLNVCAGLAEPVPPLFRRFYPDLCSPGWFWGGLIKRGSIKAFYTWARSSLGSGVWLKRRQPSSPPLWDLIINRRQPLQATLHTNLNTFVFIEFGAGHFQTYHYPHTLQTPSGTPKTLHIPKTSRHRPRHPQGAPITSLRHLSGTHTHTYTWPCLSWVRYH